MKEWLLRIFKGTERGSKGSTGMLILKILDGALLEVEDYTFTFLI